jgi:hypothetical protein
VCAGRLKWLRISCHTRPKLTRSSTSLRGKITYDLPVSGGIFLLSGEKLVEMREQAYDSEDLLQELLAKYPDLLAGDQLAGSPRRWLLVKREAGVPDREAGGSRWSLDHLFIDQEALAEAMRAARE